MCVVVTLGSVNEHEARIDRLVVAVGVGVLKLPAHGAVLHGA